MYDKEKEFGINLMNRRIIKEYMIEYKNTEYIYTIEFSDDTKQEDWLSRLDGETIEDKEYDEIMEIINNINDWADVEE
jgi:hypothetical protein